MSDNVIQGPAEWRRNAVATLADAPLEVSLEGGGGPPHDPGMEARVTAIEADVREIRGAVQRLDDRLRVVEVKLGEISGKLDLLVGKIPSWWQPPVSAGLLLALLLAAWTGAQRFGLIH